MENNLFTCEIPLIWQTQTFEVELNHGFCDMFLMPDLLRYEVKHSYILELKYLSAKDTDTKAEAQWMKAVIL